MLADARNFVGVKNTLSFIYHQHQTVIMKYAMFTLRNAMLLGLSLLPLMGFAGSPESPVFIKVGQNQKLVVEIRQVLENAELKLVNGNKETVYAEAVPMSKQTYAKALNLEAMQGGDYVLIVRNGNREVRQPFSLQENQLSLNANSRYELFLPQVKISGEALEVNLLNRQVATVRVAILNHAGELVYEDIIPNTIAVGRRYRLEKLDSGAYTVVVSTPEQVFYKDFSRKNP